MKGVEQLEKVDEGRQQELLPEPVGLEGCHQRDHLQVFCPSLFE